MDRGHLGPGELREVIRLLPAGVILLDERGRVLLYNDEEARLSGRPADSVEGRRFFEEVAPCTDVRELGGRFRAAMADPEAELDEELEFLFPFPDRDVDVRIRMRKVTVAGRRLGLLLIDDNSRLKQTERALEAALGEARELALRDPLTNLLNRRHLDMMLPGELARIQRYAYPLALLMIDLDHFKEVNDRFGHPAGDRALAAVAQALLRSIRATDYCFRVGGEEFCVVLPGTGPDEAEPVVRRIQEAIRTLEVDGSPGLQITASIGIAYAAHPPPEERLAEDKVRLELAELLRSADDALYRAKADGRDRAVVGR